MHYFPRALASVLLGALEPLHEKHSCLNAGSPKLLPCVVLMFEVCPLTLFAFFNVCVF